MVAITNDYVLYYRIHFGKTCVKKLWKNYEGTDHRTHYLQTEKAGFSLFIKMLRGSDIKAVPIYMKGDQKMKVPNSSWQAKQLWSVATGATE